MDLSHWTPQDVLALLGALTALIIALGNAYGKVGKREAASTKAVLTERMDSTAGTLQRHDDTITQLQSQLQNIDNGGAGGRA